MKLSKLATQILQENEVKVDNLSEEFELDEVQLEFLQAAVNKLNLKAAKWGVPGLKVHVVKEREEDNKKVSAWGDEEVIGVRKFFIVKIEGDAPRVEGFGFIGKIEHAPGGENILNIAPSSPIKNLPDIYKTIKGSCDVCQSNRERFNTFILQLEKDSDKFPDKKAGDLIQVGSACLKRFLPNIDVNILINYAKMLAGIRSIKGGGEDDQDFQGKDKSVPDSTRNHIPTDTLLKYVILAYVGTGKFISKKKADFENGEIPTSEEALNMMYNKLGDEHPLIQKINTNKTILQHSKDLYDKVKQWMEITNFDEFSKNNPDFANYYHNINVLSKARTIQMKNSGYFASILAIYLRHHKELNQSKDEFPKTYVGTVGGKISFHGKVIKMKSFNTKYGMSTLYVFQDLDGNFLNWWSSTDPGFIEGETYPMTAKVKSHQVDNYSKQPTTTVTHVQVKNM